MEHTELEQEIPLLALGGLPLAEQARLEEHLAVCPSCRALLSQYQFVMEELNAQVPAKQPSAQLEENLMRRIAVSPKTLPKVDAPRKPEFWRQPIALPRWAFALAALILLLLLGIMGALALRMQRVDGVNAEQVAQLVTSPDRRFVQLASVSGGAKAPEGFICVLSGNSTALLWLYNLAPLDSDHAYQIWLRSGNTREEGGLFRPGSDGKALVLVNAPRPLDNYEEIGITIESAWGSPGPTTPRVIGGRLD